ncbi:hypothetical protein GUJ93_ZPchr0002g25422 [Zizania palustris]|uniref:Uncharacterized protein n=1 Tax=Zizania palustris TaxID=103762 RepID=A0A8J5RSS0_ZIZPA|nr:hypothetical protein GUJ93_ZPchr0002g25422 [Zizania palustris]
MDAVVSVSYGALGPLLGKLNTLLADECGRLRSVRPEIRFLKSELNKMQVALHKYESLDDGDIQEKAWIAELRELAYDIEDFIDKSMHQLGANDEHDDTSSIKDFFMKSARSLQTLGSRHKIAGEIDDLKARVISVRDQKNSYKIDDTSNNSNASVDPRLAALFADENHLVGIEGPRDELINWLDVESRSMKHRKVLSIVGLGGLGKTTLANEVYRRVKVNFDCTAFTSVSRKPDMNKIFEDIISQIIMKDGLPMIDEFVKDIDTWDAKEPIEKLRELLGDKRYLVIIDDLWSISAWETIKLAFPENDCSSIIIVTMRQSNIGQSCYLNGIDRHYELEPLSDVHSRRLFCKRIFGTDENGCPDSLQEVSRDILKKCGGLPLAIISISSLLADRPATNEEWMRVKESIGFALDKNPSLEGMKSILFLSYNDLPNYLKTCLLYLSIFPENYIIERDMLLRLWIAEGFISEDCEQNMEDVAESYFYELINKSLVQPVEIRFDDLNINLVDIKAEELKTLGELPALLHLDIWMNAVPKEQLTVQSMGFACLREFVIVLGYPCRERGAYLTFEKGAMPKLEKLELPFDVLMAKSHGFYFGIDNLMCLKEAVVRIKCDDNSDTEAATAAIMNEAKENPNHPRIEIKAAR